MQFSVSRDFDFVRLKKNLKKDLKKFSKDNLDDVVSQLKQNIIRETHFNAPLHAVTKSVRLTRGNTSPKPLIETKTLLNSIKKTKAGVSFKEYGLFQDEGFRIKSGHAFYSPSKGAKKLYRVGGSTVVPRPWIIYKPRAQAIDNLFRVITKLVSVPKVTIRTGTIKI